jgi:hypothetical protein
MIVTSHRSSGSILTNSLIVMSEGVSNVTKQLRTPTTPLNAVQTRVLERSCAACVDVLASTLFGEVAKEAGIGCGIVSRVHDELVAMADGKRDALAPRVVHLLCVLPDLVMGGLGRVADKRWMPELYFGWLCAEVIGWFYSERCDGGICGARNVAGNNGEQVCAARAQVLWVLLSKACSIGHTRHVVQAWLNLRGSVAR